MSDARPEELFERFRRDGDLDALAAIFDRTAEKLLKVARHLCQDDAQAEDVVQATFLTAIESRAAFDATRELVPWLTGILTRKAKIARALSSRLITLDRLAEQAVDDPFSAVELQELRSTLERALERVPDTYRDALLLHLRDGKDTEEIARELGRPSGTIRVQLHRGLKYLRRGMPASLAFAGIAVGPRGLASMRAELLGHAGSVVAATTGSVVAGATVGGIIMGKKIAVVLGIAAIAAGVAWFGIRRRPEAQAELRAPATEAVALSAPVEEPAPPKSPPSERVQAAAPAEAPAAHDPYGSLEMEWTWADNTPAAGIGVGAASKSEPQYYDHPSFGTTDEHGRITFDHLREGTIQIYTSRDTGPKERDSAVTGGQRTSERYSIPNAEDVYGLVVDAAGLPVAGADIHISPDTEDGGSVEAKSTQAGSYFVRAVPKRMSLFATAEGRGSSQLASLRELDPEDKGEIELQLVLKGESSALRGTVVDPDGKGVFNAWVTLHPRWDHRGYPWPAVWTQTGRDGSFRLGGMHAGKADVEVVAAGYASWLKALDLEANQMLDLDVRLEPGFTVRGVARTTEGTPVKGARVEHGPPPASEDYHTWRHGVRAWTDAEGVYELAHVPSGDVDLRADLRGEGSMRRDATHRSGREGDVLTWDPVLKEGLKILGRIVDDTGKPLASWAIGAMPESGKSGEAVPNTKSDARGEFALADCAEGRTYTLSAYTPGTSIGHMPRVIERGVSTGSSVVLTAPHGWDSEAWISGRTVDENGSPLREGQVSAKHRESGYSESTHTLTADGGFKVGPLQAGHYTVLVFPKDLPGIEVSVPEELTASETRDIGTIRTRARGRCELRLTMSDGSPVDTPILVLREHGLFGHPLEGKDGVLFRSEDLYEGTYTLVINGARIATIERPVEIRAGQTASCSLSANPGTIQDIRFPTPGTELMPELLTVVVRNADGTKLLEEEASYTMTPDRKTFRTFHGGFAPGRYTVEATSSEGWTASGSFEIADSNARTSPIEMPLRKR
jgi:RNA polymerase sigma-70 factor (ECF subfamily)